MKYFVTLLFVIGFLLLIQFNELINLNTNEIIIHPTSTSNELIYHENMLKSKQSNNVHLTKMHSEYRITPYDNI